MNFAEFIENVKGAEFSFDYIRALLANLYNTFAANETVLGIWNAAEGALSSVSGFIPVILLALSLIVAFFGRKLIGIEKFLACFVIGFCAGVCYVAPYLTMVPNYITGLVIGFVAGILSKLIYRLVIIVAVGYSVYYVAFSGELLAPVTQYTANNMVLALVAAVVAVILVLVLLKLVEMLGTSLLGAWLAVLCILKLYDFTALVPGQEMLVQNVVVAVIALIAFVFQYKTRKRY